MDVSEEALERRIREAVAPRGREMAQRAGVQREDARDGALGADKAARERSTRRSSLSVSRRVSGT